MKNLCYTYSDLVNCLIQDGQNCQRQLLSVCPTLTMTEHPGETVCLVQKLIPKPSNCHPEYPALLMLQSIRHAALHLCKPEGNRAPGARRKEMTTAALQHCCWPHAWAPDIVGAEDLFFGVDSPRLPSRLAPGQPCGPAWGPALAKECHVSSCAELHVLPEQLITSELPWATTKPSWGKASSPVTPNGIRNCTSRTFLLIAFWMKQKAEWRGIFFRTLYLSCVKIWIFPLKCICSEFCTVNSPVLWTGWMGNHWVATGHRQNQHHSRGC